MYLKQLELQGFKSFIDRTKITLEPGISCIVGPNGSGKSNIADAVRWVLGEQSVKSLRGGKMEDIIFAGSKKRKPLGMAEVTIILDNADAFLPLEYTEIAVTRRAYRSGESEYLLNNKPCRLKDIYQLFVDTGIGARGFSLVSQGQVNQVVQARPEERRELIEEAAGIVKYRNRKKEAVRKLADTEHHLERLTDIIGELADRLPTLSKQAADAAAYLAYSEEAKSLETSAAVRTIGDLQIRLQELETSLAAEKEALLAAEVAQQKKEAESEALRLSIASCGDEISSLQQGLYDLNSKKGKIDGAYKVIAAKTEHLLQSREKYSQEMAQYLAKQAELQKEKELHAAESQKLAAEIEAQKQNILAAEGQNKNSSFSVNLSEDALEQAKEKAFALAQQMTEAKNDWQNSLQQNQLNNQAIARLQEQAEKFAALQTEAHAKAKFLEEALQTNRQKKQDRQRELTLSAELLQQWNKKVEEIGEAETKARFAVHSQESRLQMLLELYKNFEGYYPGVKAVLQAKQKGQPQCAQIYGVLAELLDMAPEYTTAIETALGGNMQNIVVPEAEAAKEIIAYLKERQLGRATFLPLDTLTFQPNPMVQKCLQQEGIVGRAADLVRYPQEIAAAVEFLLANVLIATDLHEAQRAAKASGYRLRIVTLAGDVVNFGGSFTGGSRDAAGTNLLSRKQNLERNQQEVTAGKKKAAELLDSLQKARLAYREAENKDDLLRKSRQELEMAQISLQKDREQQLAALDTFAKQLTQIEAEQAQLAETRRKAADLEASAKAIYETFAAENDRLSAEITAMQQNLQTMKRSNEDKREKLTKKRLGLARLEQELAGFVLFTEKQEKELADLAATIEGKEWDLAILEAEIVKEDKDQAELQQKMLVLQKEIGLCEEHFNQKKHGLAAENNLLAETEKQLKEESQRIAEQKEQVYQKDIKKARLEADLQNETANLYEKFTLSYEEALQYQKENLPDLSKKEMFGRINELKAQIADLGPVNIQAIEEYAQLKERYDFLSLQNADLQEAKTTLYQVIKEMDTIMSKRFRDTFAALSDEFNFVFQQLFGGGRAALILVEPDNILETGVEIDVSPPGKKVANYNLLSGGEKTLIGIALLFAILKIKPSPFCLLDEVDAALDEVNVERFARYLVNYTDRTQFLLISHRQGTMTIANALWGITMEEEGISKVVSVKLTGEEKAG